MRRRRPLQSLPSLLCAGLLGVGCSSVEQAANPATGASEPVDDDGEDDDEATGSESGSGPADGAESSGGDAEPTIAGTDADDRIAGTSDADRIRGYGGVDELRGAGGDDVVFGGEQLDLVFGDAGDDVLHGEQGDDVLNGGPGDDRLVGGAGDDTYVYVRGDGYDTIEDVDGAFDRLIFVGFGADEVESVEDGDDLRMIVPDGELRLVGHAKSPIIEELVYPPRDSFDDLDYGIYWHGSAAEAVKHVPGLPNPYFDPQRPTLIFVHGWSSGAVDMGFRNDLHFDEPDLDAAALWSDAGWNVGVFRWEQFADEPEVKDAEAKIWSASGPGGMRWRTQSTGYQSLNTHGRSVGDLFVREYAQTIAALHSGTVRLAGHSLGNQLVTFGAASLHEHLDAEYSARLMPRRVALLDPFWSSGAKDYLGGQRTGEAALERVTRLESRGVLFEGYRSSPASNNPFIGDTNHALLDKTCFVELRPWYFDALQLVEKHNAAAWHYLWTFALPLTRDSGGAVVCSAAASDEAIEAGTRAPHHWEHQDGAYTMTPADDVFVRVD